MNIFKCIRDVTSREEPFHTQFLAAALTDSINGDRSLFDKVWALTAPKVWEIPERPIVKAEKDLNTEQKNYGRIDILVKDPLRGRVLGIEIKTTDSSAEEQQLCRYRKGIQKKFGCACEQVAIAYLTPFNRKRAGEFADQLRTVEIFDAFQNEFPSARHVSWLDIADIGWAAGGDVWEQHCSYVRSEISSHENLKARSERNRSFDQFFGENDADDFWKTMRNLGVQPSPDKGAVVDLANIRDVRKFVGAFERLIERSREFRGEQGRKADKFPDNLREPFQKSEFKVIHEGLFELARKFDYVWVQGGNNYGVRVAHKDHKASGVSLVTSLAPDQLTFGAAR